MPQIPSLRDNQVRLGGLPSVRRAELPNTGLQSLAQGVSDIGQVTAQIRLEERAKADRAAVTEADRLLGETENTLLFDPQNGAYTRRGKNAFGLPQSVLQEYDKSAAKIGEGLTGDRQKQIFAEALNERRLRIARDLNQHEAKERESYYDETDEASLATSVESAANYANRPDRIQGELATQRSVINGIASRKGWDEAQKSRVLTQAETKTHAAVVGRLLLDNKFDAAGRYLASNAARMTDPVVEQLQRQVILQEEQAFTRLEREQKRAAEDVIKEGDRLFATGRLSAGWIESQRSVLPHEEYRYFLRKLTGDGDEENAPRDILLYSVLREQAGQGQDVRREAREALLRGQIRSTDFDRILGEVEGARPGWYKRGTQYISTSAAVSDLNPDPAAAQRKADMLDDWDNWVRENPKASESDAQAVYRRIVDEYAIINMNDLVITKRAPRFLSGTRNAPDLETTEEQTVKAFEEGKIDRVEFERQAMLIAEWRRALINQTINKPK
jgi:hypothetical protein